MLPLLLAATPQQSPQITVQDIFQRDVTKDGIVVVDWEGHLANPAITLTIVPPKDAQYPADLNLHGTNNRLHFDRTGPTDRNALNRQLRFTDPTPQTVRLTIFPDRDHQSENHQLVIRWTDATRRPSPLQTVPITVIDQDQPEKPQNRYPIHLDFSRDQTGFFKDQKVQKIIRQAADDWSDLLVLPTGLDPVPAGDEPIRLWNRDGFRSQYPAQNDNPYTGFLLHVTGIEHDEMRAGGAPSLVGKPQTVNGRPLPLLRSGSTEFDIRGNYNQLGWFVSDQDHEWWITGLQLGEPHDLYSIAVHEMGHALGFHPQYPVWKQAVEKGVFEDPRLTAYLGQAPRLDPSQHLPGTVDPVSGYGAFGAEYQSQMKTRRWLITKSHLLVLQALGYTLRQTTAFQPVTLPQTVHTHNNQKSQIKITGGIPAYHVTIAKGNLPPGLSLDTYGNLSGQATPGEYPLTLQIQDQDPTTRPVQIPLTLKIL